MLSQNCRVHLVGRLRHASLKTEASAALCSTAESVVVVSASATSFQLPCLAPSSNTTAKIKQKNSIEQQSTDVGR